MIEGGKETNEIKITGQNGGRKMKRIMISTNWFCKAFLNMTMPKDISMNISKEYHRNWKTICNNMRATIWMKESNYYKNKQPLQKWHKKIQ